MLPPEHYAPRAEDILGDSEHCCDERPGMCYHSPTADLCDRVFARTIWDQFRGAPRRRRRRINALSESQPQPASGGCDPQTHCTTAGRPAGIRARNGRRGYRRRCGYCRRRTLRIKRSSAEKFGGGTRLSTAPRGIPRRIRGGHGPGPAHLLKVDYRERGNTGSRDRATASTSAVAFPRSPVSPFPSVGSSGPLARSTCTTRHTSASEVAATAASFSVWCGTRLITRWRSSSFISAISKIATRPRYPV